jgi:ribosomal-protein-alanine N-acetyltransferase
LLLLALLYKSIALDAVLATLEVRVSNEVARALYAKYGFEVVGRRKRYYADNQEDALIMTVAALDDAYRAELGRLQEALFTRLRTTG